MKQTTILLVDDEAIIALEQTHRLTSRGFHATSVHSGERAIAYLDEHPTPDLILMDIRLGAGIDGIEACRRIRARWDVPVIFFSNSTDTETLALARDASPYGYVRKLADEFTLIRAIETAIDLHALIARARPLDPSEPEPEACDCHYLKREFYRLLREDPHIFDFFEAGSLDGVWYWDLEHPEHEWLSPSFWRTLGFDPATKQHLASEWNGLIHPDDLKVANENFRKHLANPDHPYDQVVRYRHADGSTVWVRCRGVAVRDAEGRPIRMLGAHSEITEIMNAHEEQKRLVKEMNHRIKNNLAMLQAMISVEQGQSGKSKESSLSDIEARLHAVALIHDRLSSSLTADVVALRDYVTDLAERYTASLGTSRAIGFDLSIADVLLSSKAASRIGMIVSELISNTLRHRSHRAAHEPVRLSISEIDATLYVSYRDGGAAPEGVRTIDDLETGTGLTLIRALASEMNGDLELRTDDGLTFEMTLFLNGNLLGRGSEANREATGVGRD